MIQIRSTAELGKALSVKREKDGDDVIVACHLKFADLFCDREQFDEICRARNMETTLAHWRTWPRKTRLGMASTARKGAHPTVGYIDGYVDGWKARGRRKCS